MFTILVRVFLSTSLFFCLFMTRTKCPSKVRFARTDCYFHLCIAHCYMYCRSRHKIQSRFIPLLLYLEGGCFHCYIFVNVSNKMVTTCINIKSCCCTSKPTEKILHPVVFVTWNIHVCILHIN